MIRHFTLVLCTLAFQAGAISAEEKPSHADLEAQTLKALGSGSAVRLQAVAEEIRDLKSEDRAKLPLRVRADGVEFRFRGESPGDKGVWESLEYVISDGEKAHKSLLIVAKTDLARLEKIGQTVAVLRRANKQFVLEFKLAWVEDGQARVEDLYDMVDSLGEAPRKQFLEQLVFQEHGFGGSTNVKADVARLPAQPTKAELLLSVRLR